MAIEGMNHFTILTNDVDGTIDFYDELLGLTAGPRPDFDFPGARTQFACALPRERQRGHFRPTS